MADFRAFRTLCSTRRRRHLRVVKLNQLTVGKRSWLGVGAAAVAAVAATGAFGGSGGDTMAQGAAVPGAVAPKPTLSVAVLGSGSVASKPAGISCPRKCSATFAAGSRVLLTPKANRGSRFLRWGGSCTGTGTCRVRVSALAAVAAQFVRGPKTQPPPPPPTSVVESGTYSGQNSQNGNGMTFFVTAGGRSVVNFSIPNVGAVCTGGGGASDHILILAAAIRSDGSFTARTSQDGLLPNGTKAKFTYSITGRFQRATAGGAATAAGSYREDIVFTDTPSRTCTSNDQTWKATRSPQPSQQRYAVVPGSYSGQNSQNGNGMTFVVAAGGGRVVNFSIPNVGAVCAGGGGASDHILISEAAIRPDGSFTARTSQDGLLPNGTKAKFTYSITGHFQGVNAAGAAIAAGSYREDIVFTDSPTRTCTSNDQFWTATRR